MKFSASKLVKQSAVSLYNKRYTYATKSLSSYKVFGEKVAHERSQGLIEMSGCYNGLHTIFYVFDEIRRSKNKSTKLIEHKSFQFADKSGRYFKQCLAQVAFYRSLHKLNKNKLYQTASFRKHIENNLLQLDEKTISLLFIGNSKYSKYRVKVKNCQKIVDFYLQKAEASLSYDTAKEWDKKWYNKESDHVLKFVTYERKQS